MSLDALLEEIQYLPAAEAEDQVRAFLLRASGSATDADTLAILLKDFRVKRDHALEGYQSWESIPTYCRRLTALCDKNFVATTGGEPGESLDFPASVVATVYAECGRTLALAEELQQSRAHLLKAVAVFAITPESGEGALSVAHQKAATRAALARVLRKLGHSKSAEREYLEALQLYMPLPHSEDVGNLITEYCDVLGDLGGDCFVAPDFIGDLASQMYGEGSEAHLLALKDVADVCIAVGHRAQAAPVLEQRARLLRIRCSGGGCSGGKGGGYPMKGMRRSPGAMLQAEAEVAEEEAAQAFEQAAAIGLEEGNLEVVAEAWAEALRLREASGGEGSQVVIEMRSALAAIRAALAGGEGSDSGQKPNEQEERPPKAEEKPAMGAGKSAKVGSLTGAGGGLRPSWAR